MIWLIFSDSRGASPSASLHALHWDSVIASMDGTGYILPYTSSFTPAKSIVLTPRVCWNEAETAARGAAEAPARTAFAAATKLRRWTAGLANWVRALRAALLALREAIGVEL